MIGKLAKTTSFLWVTLCQHVDRSGDAGKTWRQGAKGRVAVTAPTVRRRRLGSELRRLREAARLTLEEVEARSGLSTSKVSRIESAARGAKPADVEQLMDVYQVADSEVRAFLSALARDGSKRGWWQTYDLKPRYADLISMEHDAVTVSTFEPMLVPGLLQTAAYARAVIGTLSTTATPQEVARLVEVRVARQSVLTRPGPLALHAVIHEAALTTRVPGAGVMRDQLQRLLDATAHPNLTVQVLPLDAELHPGAAGGFATLGFGQPALDVVLLEQLDRSLYIEEPHEVKRYADAFETLAALALTPEQSRCFITAKKDAVQ
ncbi:helix-turn-helix domain-containing protein [Streptomyces sp. NPDC048603]|uniref:helix-turn-helix domain-containing protein n=1 Tax=Streptomyces sp. NPDC048603 TaxID=3365577 RepID=UPI003719CF49